MDDAHAAAQLHALARTTPDVLVTIDTRSRIQFVNPAIEEILGYAPADLTGEPLTEIMPPHLAERHQEAVDRYLSTRSKSFDWQEIELPGQHRDGHEVPLSISFSEFTLEGERYFTGILRDVSGRRRRADKLERLIEFTQDLLGAESVDAVCERAIAAAEDLLDVPLAEVVMYDPDAAKLRTRSRTSAAKSLDGDSLFRSERGLPWQVFVEDTVREFADGSDADPADETPLASAILAPIGSHGVFVAGTSDGEDLSETDGRIVRLLASTLATVLDRLDRERTLRERTGELEAKHAEYERVQRINDVIRDITQVLLAASSREEIKEIVCERLATNAPYRFVWFGEHDVTTDEIVPVAWAGAEQGYLDAVEVTADEEPTGLGPAGRALRTGTPQTQNDTQSDPPFEPWRQEAIKRNFRSLISVPIAYGETTYGVLSLYASEPDIFGGREESVLQELGEMVGYGLNAMERYDALVAEDSVELEFRIRDDSNPMVELLRDHQGRFHLESIGERHGGSQHVFIAFEGVPLEAIRSFAGQSAEETVRVISQHDEETIVRLALPPDSVTVTLLDRGAVPTELRGTPEEAHLTVRISREASVRELLELLEARYADVELIARRDSPEPVRTVEQFEEAYLDRLTDRQREVLRTAYHAGFFEQPRASSARDVADILDVSQPTVSRHIRAGERALFSLLFDEQ